MSSPDPGPLASEAVAVVGRLDTAVLVLTIDAHGSSNLVRAQVVSIHTAADMLRSVARALDADAAAEARENE